MSHNKQWAFLIILLFSMLSCKIAKNNENEPNNTFSTANKIEINKEISGYLDTENDIDNYIISIAENQILKIELGGIKGVNHALHIYKYESGKPLLLKIIDDNRKSAPETFANLFVQPGQYIFSVTHGSRDLKKGNTETPYKLLITSRSVLNEEKEPNDNAFSATEINDNLSVTGYYSPGQNSLNNDAKTRMKEIDWYKFVVDLQDNNPVLIDLNISGVSGVDSVISISNSAMEEILSLDNSGTGEGETLSDFGISQSGIYYIQVSSKNFLFNHTTPYELSLKFKQYDPGTELEPNNSFEKANPLVNNIAKGTINGLNDKDFFYFNPAFKNKYYKAECSVSAGTDIIMTIYDSNRNKLFEINNAGPGETEKIPYFQVKNSIYISISASAVSGADSGYSLSLEQNESNDVIETEPNNTKSTSNPVSERISGYITYKNDVDYFLLKYEDRHKVKITVQGVKDGKIRVSTTDPLGFIIKSIDIESDQQISFNEIFDKKGYLIVEPINHNFENPYTITIEDAK